MAPEPVQKWYEIIFKPLPSTHPDEGLSPLSKPRKFQTWVATWTKIDKDILRFRVPKHSQIQYAIQCYPCFLFSIVPVWGWSSFNLVKDFIHRQDTWKKWAWCLRIRTILQKLHAWSPVDRKIGSLPNRLPTNHAFDQKKTRWIHSNPTFKFQEIPSGHTHTLTFQWWFLFAQYSRLRLFGF